MRRDRTDRQSMLLSFSGIDGAGKSSQIVNLCSHLREAKLRVQVIEFWNDVARLKGIREGVGYKVFKGDKGVGTPEAPIERRDKNVRSPLMTVIRMAIYVIDAISLRRKARSSLRSDADIVIFDRYMYDELANLEPRSATQRFYMWLLMKLVPRPAISFVLDADPASAYARKPEYPLEFVHSNRNAYLKLNDLLGSITVVPPMPMEQAKTHVVQCVWREWTHQNARKLGEGHTTQQPAKARTQSDGPPPARSRPDSL